MLMISTALQIALQEQSSAKPPALAEYRGVSTAGSFGNPQLELATLRTSCGVYDLGFRAKLALTGSDRVRWLNGMVTNNIRDLAVGSGVYTFLLNPQGKILGDLNAYNLGESITLDTDQSQVEKLLATFDRYIIMDDVEVKNISEEQTALGIAGLKSQDVLTSGFQVSELQPLQLQNINWRGLECTVVRSEDTSNQAYEIWTSPANVKQIWDALLVAGAAPIGSEALEMQRIIAGIPVYGIDIRDRDLPQETEQARALNFNKGCYVGQEIVERIRSRGNVHRKFAGFLVEDGVPIVPGAKILVGDKETGEITSTTFLHRNGAKRTVALGYIRREAGVPGREVMIGEFRATIVSLPLQDATLWQSRDMLVHS